MPSDKLFWRPFVTHGLPRRLWQDFYHRSMTVSWPTFFLSFTAFYFVFNLLFSLLYSFEPTGIVNLDPPGFWGRFFFSIETFSTVGYGDMHPRDPYTHVVVSAEIFAGTLGMALLTGLMFARFSRPTARFLFARYAVIRPIEGRTTLMLRAANARQNIVMEAAANLRLVRDETSKEGYHQRRIHDLALTRSQHPIFLFGWNLQHIIDESSPLWGQTEATLSASGAILLLSVSGTDETTGQQLMARHAYPASMLRWNHSFVDILHVDESGIDHFDYRKFHDIEPLADPR